VSKKNSKKIFAHPWKYKEGFIVTGILFILSIIIELATGDFVLTLPKFPSNWAIILTFTSLIVFLQIYLKDNKIIQWLGSSPAAIVSILYVLFLSILLGLTPQLNSKEALLQYLNVTELSGKWVYLYKLGITNMTESWLFFSGMLFILFTLGFVTVKRSIPFKKKNFGFILNHFGLYLVLIAAVAGTSDKQDFAVVVNKGEQNTTNVAFAWTGEKYALPFSFTLNKFSMEEYNPKLVFYNAQHEEITHQNDNTPFEFKENTKGEFDDWQIEVSQYYEKAWIDTASRAFVKTEDLGNVQAAYIIATNKKTNKKAEGWVSCGNAFFPRANLVLSNNEYFVMLEPEAKRYLSNIDITNNQGEKTNLDIEVNKPKKYKGWKIYQSGYNEEMGKWSTSSTFQIVRDPWLPVVYIGLFMLLAGAVYIFWIGKEKK